MTAPGKSLDCISAFALLFAAASAAFGPSAALTADTSSAIQAQEVRPPVDQQPAPFGAVKGFGANSLHRQLRGVHE